MRRWQNDAVLIVGSFVLGAIFITICLGWWPDTGDEKGIPVHPFWRFLWQWQTLLTGIVAVGVGVAAWRGLQAQIASARDNTDRELNEMRRQFRHEMEVRTAAERYATDRELSRPLVLLEAALLSIEKIRGANATPDPEKAVAYYRSGLMQYGSRLTEWLAHVPAPISSYLSAEREHNLAMLSIRLDLLGIDDDPADERRLEDIESGIRRVLAVLKEIEREVRSAVPP